MKTITPGILIGIIGGTLYYIMMEKSIPNHKNCSYLATPLTDILAFIYGIIVCCYANTYNNDILNFLGTTIIVEHIFQLLRK
jgi:hypothetical protein